jgi:hypothetical protein
MALIVMPLMFGQLITYTIPVFQEQNVFSICGMLVIVTLWISTFLQFVPLHQQISTNSVTDKTLELLVARNWIRVVLWTGLFIWNVIAL